MKSSTSSDPGLFKRLRSAFDNAARCPESDLTQPIRLRKERVKIALQHCADGIELKTGDTRLLLLPEHVASLTM